MKFTHETLVNAFKAALDAAQVHAQSEDGGTCNFDTAVFPLNRTRRTTIEKAANEAGVYIQIRKWWTSQWVFVNVGTGQGNRNTRMAEAACKALQSHGLNAVMYYQMD